MTADHRPIPTRWSHLLRYSGVGALVRGDDYLVVVEDCRSWLDRHGQWAGELIYYVDLLRASLQIEQQLRQPPAATELQNGEIDGSWLRAPRFPGWMRCPSCGQLHWRPWQGREDPSPPACRCDAHARLQQVEWVVAHPEGGMRDVPWHFLAHADESARMRCRADNQQPYLRLKRVVGGRHWQLSCDRCQSAAWFQTGQRLEEHWPRSQPWERRDGGGHMSVETGEPAQVLEVNDPRLYYPQTRNALVIGPEARIPRGTVIDCLFRNKQHRQSLDQCRTDLQLRGKLRSLADQYACTVTALREAWGEIEAGYPLYGHAMTPGALMAGEYQALIEPIAALSDKEDFVPRHQTPAWRALAGEFSHDQYPKAPGPLPADILTAVDRLVAVTRLREIQVFEGFSRIDQEHRLPPDLDGSLDWLPAIELFGEGIFFSLDIDMLARWEQQPALQQRLAGLRQRFERSGMRFANEPPTPLTPRFVLLHTLAHLLIRQLETSAGYPAASLQERIYCGDGVTAGVAVDQQSPMAGILVYVAVPDVVGSLGGLAELAQPRRFLRLLSAVFEHADWCSLDPVCSEHQGQGPNLLNLAACHACALVPEPSCAYGNVLLDRCFVKGDVGGGIRPLLAFTERRE